MVQTSGEQVTAALASAREAVADHTRLGQRIDRADRAVVEASAALDAARRELASESADVEKLESFSPTRIWAALRGSRDADLDRERAEQQAAQYRAAVAEQRVQQARAERSAAEAARAALGDVSAQLEAARVAKQEWMATTGHPAAAELDDVAQHLGTAASTRTETIEALQAADAALAALGEAGRMLESAGGWAAWDTFGGGGMLTDMAKYDRMDRAQARMAAADQALRRLSAELADVGMAAVGGVEVTQLARTFDVFFDNIFSDWAVRNRISEAGERVARARRAVLGAREELVRRATALDAELATLAARRTELLG
ncbi:hypothetical protein [Nocardioides acrostichi]|uniref:Uncharacterized protein n=1 Tax=Nocardioides acrostichi TaxID=2784339 RepID=A0A930UZX6_9ACTN|nr:hypothetical protein [Nocardioides acrostichi]MBF4163983.1 hypothetical protein [Nocardioides acrostichi]